MNSHEASRGEAAGARNAPEPIAPPPEVVAVDPTLAWARDDAWETVSLGLRLHRRYIDIALWYWVIHGIITRAMVASADPRSFRAGADPEALRVWLDLDWLWVLIGAAITTFGVYGLGKIAAVPPQSGARRLAELTVLVGALSVVSAFATLFLEDGFIVRGELMASRWALIDRGLSVARCVLLVVTMRTMARHIGDRDLVDASASSLWSIAGLVAGMVLFVMVEAAPAFFGLVILVFFIVAATKLRRLLGELSAAVSAEERVPLAFK